MLCLKDIDVIAASEKVLKINVKSPGNILEFYFQKKWEPCSEQFGF